MSVIVGHGMLITVSETVLECPICTGKFDAWEKMDKAKCPMFNMKCPLCKGRIRVLIPVYGGTTKVWEVASSPACPAAMTEAPFTVNGAEPAQRNVTNP